MFRVATYIVIFVTTAVLNGQFISQAAADERPIPLQQLSETSQTIPVTVAGARHTLDAIIIRPNDGIPRPLVVISHGNPRDASDARGLRLRTYHSVAEDFARRGYVAAIFARRGFAGSSGQYHETYGTCEKPDYTSAMKSTALDFRAFIEAMQALPDVDGSTVIAIGQSGGGAGVIALAGDPPSGLKAVINFSGGRGSPGNGINCERNDLVDAFGHFGSSSNPPSLWLYSSADRYFGPSLAEEMKQAYEQAGGRVVKPAIGALRHFSDGHRLVRRGSRPIWRPAIDEFLNANGLQNWSVAPPEHALLAAPAPRNLGKKGRSNWTTYLGSDLHKAFAIVPGEAAFGWVSRMPSREEAIRGALAACRGDRKARNCKIAAENDEIQK